MVQRSHKKQRKNIVAANSVDLYGNNANIHGMHVSFAAMTCITVIMILVALLCIKSISKKDCIGK